MVRRRKRRRRDQRCDGVYHMGSALMPEREPPTIERPAPVNERTSAQPSPADDSADAERSEAGGRVGACSPAATAASGGAGGGGAASGGRGGGGYDRVLVDAECTHDGSIKHLAKFAQWGWETFEKRVMDAERLDALAALQLNLLRVGFRSLRAGGTLVYSTCSFARAQNEAVVAALLDEAPHARLEPVPTLQHAPCRAGTLPHTLRFEPRTSHTSGLFVARLTKLAAPLDSATP